MKNAISLLALLALAPPLFAQQRALDWNAIEEQGLENLRGYIRIDTQNPPDRVTGAAAYLRGLLEKEGFAVTVYEPGPGRENVLARLPATAPGPHRKAILLLNHMDVVPVDPTRWTVPPFGAEVKDGRVWGRGAMDMKGPGTIQLMALVALKRAGVALDRDVIFLATADEETGGDAGAGWMIEHHYAELDPEYVIDEGGFGSRDVFAAGRLVWGISIADKRPYWLRVTASGASGHASQPVPDNANVRLMHALERILAPLPPAQSPLVAAMRRNIGTFADNKFMRAIGGNTVSLTVLRAGVGEPPKVNVIPSRSVAMLDCRLLPGVDPQPFLAMMQSRAGADAQVQADYLVNDAPSSSTTTPFYSAIDRVLQRASPGAVVTPVMVPYSTDGHKFRARGASVYGFSPVVIDLPTVSSLHSDQEQIPVEQFKKGIHLMFEILSEAGGSRARP